MPVSLILFLVVIVMGLGMACWLAFRVGEAGILPTSKTLRAEASRLQRYQILCRLFDQADTLLIKAHMGVHGDATAQQLNRNRRRVMRMYLRELRSDFSRFWSLCRLLAPYSPDPQFGAMLFSQLFLFHTAVGLLWIQTYSGTPHLDTEKFSNLIDAVQRIRGAAQTAVEGAERFALESPTA